MFVFVQVLFRMIDAYQLPTSPLECGGGQLLYIEDLMLPLPLTRAFSS